MPGVPKDKITFKTSDLGVVHTHPNSSIPGPSKNDIEAAKKIRKTVWVTPKGGSYAVEPDG
jgi:hypothetical protein